MARLTLSLLAGALAVVGYLAFMASRFVGTQKWEAEACTFGVAFTFAILANAWRKD